MIRIFILTIHLPIILYRNNVIQTARNKLQIAPLKIVMFVFFYYLVSQQRNTNRKEQIRNGSYKGSDEWICPLPCIATMEYTILQCILLCITFRTDLLSSRHLLIPISILEIKTFA